MTHTPGARRGASCDRDSSTAEGAASTAGDDMYQLILELFPLCRSITGQGTRQTLEALRSRIPISVRGVPSGSMVLDWVVPPEWNIRGAYIQEISGRRLVDFAESNLHVMGYSTPVHHVMPVSELREHLFSIPEHPSWIPYRTSYYQENWGFCVRDSLLQTLTDETYEVCIDSDLAPGTLRYGELLIPGSCDREVLISTHICHPSLCNDNLSGIALAVQLAAYFMARENRYSYRFLFVPATIGALAWLSQNEGRLNVVSHGLVLAGVGDSGNITYKKSRRADTPIDRAMHEVLARSGDVYNEVDFSPYGYDERQYCSPGFDLPVGTFTRTPYGAYPEYHTSADDLSFVQPESLQDSFDKTSQALLLLEADRTYVNLKPHGEPQLGRRGLFEAVRGGGDPRAIEMAMLWVLSLSDGATSILRIAERAKLAFESVCEAATALAEAGLLLETSGYGTD